MSARETTATEQGSGQRAGEMTPAHEEGREEHCEERSRTESGVEKTRPARAHVQKVHCEDHAKQVE